MGSFFDPLLVTLLALLWPILIVALCGAGLLGTALLYRKIVYGRVRDASHPALQGDPREGRPTRDHLTLTDEDRRRIYGDEDDAGDTDTVPGVR